MSYASVASHNAPPPSEQPQPDPSLLTTQTTPPPPTVDDTSKVNVVPTDFKEHPCTVTSQIGNELRSPDEGARSVSQKKDLGSRGGRKNWFERVFGVPLFMPSVSGGLLATANIGLLGTVGYFAYITRGRPHWERQILPATIIGLLSVWIGEGALIRRLQNTGKGF